MLTIYRPSVNSNDAVYGSNSCQDASSSKYRQSRSGHNGHHGSSKLSSKTKNKSKKGRKSTKSEADKKQQQAKDLAEISTNMASSDDYQYAMADDGTFYDDIDLSPDNATGA
ncbi:uncharacterized protein PG998_004533 [Apiospora kogelbergensis]|uniref:uncharacterized protein n=1 Tax=Apiospora kogelbergensis TaxID=1337665 RepID=UPI003131A157